VPSHVRYSANLPIPLLDLTLSVPDTARSESDDIDPRQVGWQQNSIPVHLEMDPVDARQIGRQQDPFVLREECVQGLARRWDEPARPR